MNGALLEVWKAAPTGVALGESSLARSVDLITTAEGGVAKLRKLILALAVRGILSTQQDSDESAEHLLSVMTRLKRERAAASRARAESAPSDLFAEVEGFVLPTGWGWAGLGQLGWFASGKTPSTSKADYWDGSIPWVTPKDMKAPRLSDSEDHVSERAVADGLALIPASAVLVVVRSGILRRMVPVAITQMTCTVNQDIKALTLYQPAMAGYVQLMITGFESFILSQLTKIGTTVESIKFEEFSACRFPIPPLAEQHRIVARVDELMKLCDALEENGRLADEQHARLVSTLFDALAGSASARELAENWSRVAEHFDLLLDRPEAIDKFERTIVDLAIRGRLVHQEATGESALDFVRRVKQELNLSHQRLVAEAARDGTRSPRRQKMGSEPDARQEADLPTGWHRARVGEVSQCLDSLRVPVNKEQRQARSGRVPYYGANGQVDWIDACLFDEDLVLVVEDETFIGRVKPFSYVVRGKSWVNNHAHVLRPLGGMSADYLNLCLHRYDFIPLTSGTTARRKLTQPGLLDATFPLAPLAEQHRIVARVEKLRLLCAELRGKLTEARYTQTALAEALVAGMSSAGGSKEFEC